MHFDINALLAGQLFAFMIVFVRLSAGMMMFPGIGEAFVSARIRIMLALAVTFLLFQPLTPSLPQMPTQTGELLLLIVREALIGLFFGAIVRLLMDILETTGAIIGMNMGLSNAMILNPSLGAQSALPSVFLGVAAIALIFITGLDHLLFRALLNTYRLFPVGQPLPVSDMAQSYAVLLARSFTIGAQLGMPFFAMGLMAYAVVGIMQKMMPQIQLFLILMPALIWAGLFVLSASAGIILTLWLATFDNILVMTFWR
ncbi:MAG: flagellar biosynthetic protein FliR [Alphaproteobacteria bacterium]|nr:flagellar biosynthetic protein FliR [Alphaproteobacteria bacterium]